MKRGYKKTALLILKIVTGALLSWVLIGKLKESAAQFDLNYITDAIGERQNLQLILFCILLMPLNWMLESWKWMLIINATIDRISFFTAFKSVLSGVAFGNLAPGRATEFAGKILFIPEGNRVKATYLHFVSGSSQLIVTLFAGMSVVLFNGIPDGISEGIRIVTYILVPVLLVLLLLFFFNPDYTFSRLTKVKFIRKIADGEIKVGRRVLVKIFSISVIRYLVFLIQFILVAAIFFSEKDPVRYVPGICLYYLFASVVPMISVIEAFMRGGIAVLVFAYIEPNSVSIFICSTAIWLVNVVVPSVAGYLFFLFLRPKEN